MHAIKYTTCAQRTWGNTCIPLVMGGITQLPKGRVLGNVQCMYSSSASSGAADIVVHVALEIIDVL